MIHPADQDRLADQYLGMVRGAGILLRGQFREVLRLAVAASWAECERTCAPRSFRTSEGYTMKSDCCIRCGRFLPLRRRRFCSDDCRADARAMRELESYIPAILLKVERFQNWRMSVSRLGIRKRTIVERSIVAKVRDLNIRTSITPPP